MHETEDVVGRLTDHRIAGVRGIERILDGLTAGVAPARKSTSVRHHHLAEASGSSIENIFDDLPFLRPRVLDPRTRARISSSISSRAADGSPPSTSRRRWWKHRGAI